jgi:uncharacterized protein YlxP (DUF503 family)
MGASPAMARWVLQIPGCRSLKEKRRVIHGLRDRLRSRFDVSVAETGLQDVRDRAELSAALVTSDGRLTESLLSRIDDHVSSDPRWFILEREIRRFG